MATNKHIGVIAAEGALPRIIVDALLARGYQPVVVALEGMAAGDFPCPTHQIYLGSVGKIIKAFQEDKCDTILMSGTCRRLPLAQLKPDMQGMVLAGKVLAAGDDHAMKVVQDFLEKNGFIVADLKKILPNLYAEKGVLAGKRPSKKQKESITRGLEILTMLGHGDVGQGVVMQEGRVLAIEAAEGTDAMLARSGALADKTRLAPILIKGAKIGQDQRLDPPVIGADTIIAAADAGVDVVAIGAGEVVLAGREAIVAAAEKHKISLIGVAR